MRKVKYGSENQVKETGKVYIALFEFPSIIDPFIIEYK